MREELFGLEDSFKFASHVMQAYARAEIEQRDNSVELYLLNHWVKDLSLRDLIDRVSNSCQQDEKIFLALFKWLNFHSISGNQEAKWQIEDFRKVALQMAKNVEDENVSDFFQNAVDRLGHKKI